MSKTFLETIVILSLRWRGVAGKKLCKQLVGPWCHEKCPSPPFTARPAAGTILATLHSGLTHFGTLYIFTRAAHRGLSVYWSRALLVCNAQFYTIPIVQAIEQECIAHRQCAVTQNNERFCRGGLSSAVTITGRVEGWLNIYRRNSCRQPQPLLQTLSTVTMSSLALI